jgi:DNA-binding MarR family transcriptional regulator
MALNPFENDSSSVGRRIATGLSKISLAMKSRAWAEGTDRHLTPTQGQILALLRLRAHPGLRLTELAEGLGVTAATASDAVSALEEKGLVQKGRQEQDGRALQIVLTASGKREADRACGWPDFLLQGIAALSPAEQAVFLRGIVKMIRSLQDLNEIPVSRMCVTCQFFQPNVHNSPTRPHHCAFVDAPFGDGHLRLECPDHQPAEPDIAGQTWKVFTTGHPSMPEKRRSKP